MVYTANREEIAKLLVQGLSVQLAFETLELKKAGISYSSLTRYVAAETWAGIDSEEVDVDHLKAQLGTTIRRGGSWKDTSARAEVAGGARKRGKSSSKDRDTADAETEQEGPLDPGAGASKPKTFTLPPSHEEDESDLF